MEENNQKEKKWYHFFKLKDFQKVSMLNSTFSIFFNLLPFWGGLLFTISIGKWTDWSRFYENGEFYLYSVSLISSAYLIYHNNKIKTSDINSFFSIISLILIVIVSFLYASLSSNPDPQINIFIKWASIIAILCAVPIFFHSQLVANRNSPNVVEKRKDEQETIINGIN
ncbi:hypothetical protein [Algibacter sp. 2305UL17-15]|uniref:hypothetical protein n=1 Tax=Algibacter sp. 2305UL17-15 TaxID=3231268 RepID=UPI0034582A89